MPPLYCTGYTYPAQDVKAAVEDENGIPLYTLRHADEDGDVLTIAPVVTDNGPQIAFEIGNGSGTDDPYVVYVPAPEAGRVIDAVRQAAALAERGKCL
jgi:hypothetical protein